MPSACATIRRCAGLSAAKRRRAARPRRARWAGLRRRWLVGVHEPLGLLPIFASGSTLHCRRLLDDRARYWIQVSLTRAGKRRSLRHTACMAAIIRCSYSISLAIWNVVCCVRATCTVLMAGTVRSSRSLWLSGQGLAHLFPGGRLCHAGKCSVAAPGGGADQRRDPVARQIEFCRAGSATCSSARSGDRRTRCAVSMLISPIRREAGSSRAG